MGAAFPALQIAALYQVSAQNAGLGSGVQNTVLQIGGSIGLAVLVTVAVRRAASSVAVGTGAAVAATQGYALAFRVAALAMFAAALVALFLVSGRQRQQGAENDALDGRVLEARRGAEIR